VLFQINSESDVKLEAPFQNATLELLPVPVTVPSPVPAPISALTSAPVLYLIVPLSDTKNLSVSELA